MKGRGALRWPLGGFLVASALGHAALFGLPLDLTPGSRTPQAPVAVTFVSGLSRAGKKIHRQTPQQVAPAPRRTLRHQAAESQRVVTKQPPKPVPKPKPKPKPTLKPAEKTPSRPAPVSPALPTQNPPSTAAEESSSVPAAAAALPVPNADAPPGEARPEVTTVEVDEPPRDLTGSPGAISGGAPLTADFGSANGPRILQLEQPVYPPRALRLRREGEVLLRLEIDSSGHLQSATVVESAGYGFDASALDALRRARFAPASRGGLSVPCVALLPVSFTLATRP